MSRSVQVTEQQHRALRLILRGDPPGEVARILGVSRYRARVIVRRLCDLFDVDHVWDLADAADGVEVEVLRDVPGGV